MRADIVVYASKAACLNRDQGKINFVVECKRNKVEDGYAQLVSYIFNTSANGGVWTNGDGTVFYRRENKDGIQVLEETPGLPRCGQGWEDGRTPRIGELERPRNVRRLLAMCHNRLYGRGMENADSDLTMDMVRILLAKIYDETVTSDTAYPHFWITPEQYKSEDGRAAVAKTIRSLFHEYAEQYPTVFDKDEDIAVGDSTLVEAASVLQDYSFVSREDDADDWDLMGAAYEQFTHVTLKRQQGQFFTNRLVVKAMVDMLDPDIADKVLDPAGGSGGFATAAFRYKRRKAIDGTKPGSPQRERRLGLCKNSVFLVEISKRLVKIAKTAMLLTGDGNTGMTQGNSLDKYSNLDGWITSHCPKGTPDIIITNPPFSGQKTESMMMDPDILKLFGFGHRPDPEGTFPTITDDDDRDAGHGTLLIRQAPELLSSNAASIGSSRAAASASSFRKESWTTAPTSTTAGGCCRDARWMRWSRCTRTLSNPTQAFEHASFSSPNLWKTIRYPATTPSSWPNPEGSARIRRANQCSHLTKKAPPPASWMRT